MYQDAYTRDYTRRTDRYGPVRLIALKYGVFALPVHLLQRQDVLAAPTEARRLDSVRPRPAERKLQHRVALAEPFRRERPHVVIDG